MAEAVDHVGRRVMPEPYPYVYVNADGTARELHATERQYLETEFSPADGARPFIKWSYEDRNGWGEIRGYLERSALPPDIPIHAAPLDVPSEPMSKTELIAWLRAKGLKVVEMPDGSVTAQELRRGHRVGAPLRAQEDAPTCRVTLPQANCSSARVVRWLLATVGLIVLGSILVVFLYLNGAWPHRVVCEIRGPEGARLVSVADRTCDETLPCEIHLWSDSLPVQGDHLVCPIEVVAGNTRCRGRLSADRIACLKTGYMDLVSAAESMDGSAWVCTDTNRVETWPARPDRCLLVYRLGGRGQITVQGVEQPRDNHGVVELAAGRAEPQEIRSDGWTLRITADAGTCVSLNAWGPGESVVVRCEDAGFASGTVAVDGAPLIAMDLGSPSEYRAQRLDVALLSSEGRAAHVQVERRAGYSGLTLRVSR